MADKYANNGFFSGCVLINCNNWLSINFCISLRSAFGLYDCKKSDEYVNAGRTAITFQKT